MTTVEYAERKDGTIKVYAPNGTHLGDLLMGDDGYYEFWPELNRAGYWPSWVLRDIANKVDALNEPWDKIVQTDNSI